MKLNEELVSVIVPVYNAEKYLGRCVESILAQTYRYIEIILINDGSRDNSLKECYLFSEKDRRIKVVNKQNSGVSATRNLGITLANGSFLCFIDSDDYIENDYIEKMLMQNQDKALTICGYFIDTYKENGTVSVAEKRYKNNGIAIKDNFADIFHQGFLSAIWNKIYDVEILRKNNLKFDESLSLGEDLLFNLEYLKTGIDNFIFIDVPLYHYIKHGTESLDNKYRKDFLEIQEKLFEKLISVAELYMVADIKKSIIYSDFMSAIIVSIDNFYIFNKDDAQGVKDAVRRACESIEEHEIMFNISDKDQIICKFRYFLLKKGFFKVDFLLRKMIKRILKV